MEDRENLSVGVIAGGSSLNRQLYEKIDTYKKSLRRDYANYSDEQIHYMAVALTRARPLTQEECVEYDCL
jgi:hypothetical protein